jgi:predicted transcriptional regulator
MTAIKNKVLIILLLSTTCMASYGSTRRRCRDFKKEDVLEQGTRNTIYELIDKNPGLHFRKICRILDKKMGVVQYHIGVLEKIGLVRAIRDGRYKCFFASNQDEDSNVSPDDRDPERQHLRETIITSLRRKTPKTLITYLAREKIASHQSLSIVAQVSPQAITFHTQRLQSFGIIESQKEGRQKFYTLSPTAKQITENLMK